MSNFIVETLKNLASEKGFRCEHLLAGVPERCAAVEREASMWWAVYDECQEELEHQEALKWIRTADLHDLWAEAGENLP